MLETVFLFSLAKPIHSEGCSIFALHEEYQINWALLLLCSISTVTYARKTNPRKGIEISKGYISKFIKENKKIRICFTDSSKTAVK